MTVTGHAQHVCVDGHEECAVDDTRLCGRPLPTMEWTTAIADACEWADLLATARGHTGGTWTDAGDSYGTWYRRCVTCNLAWLARRQMPVVGHWMIDGPGLRAGCGVTLHLHPDDTDTALQAVTLLMGLASDLQEAGLNPDTQQLQVLHDQITEARLRYTVSRPT